MSVQNERAFKISNIARLRYIALLVPPLVLAVTVAHAEPQPQDSQASKAAPEQAAAPPAAEKSKGLQGLKLNAGFVVSAGPATDSETPVTRRREVYENLPLTVRRLHDLIKYGGQLRIENTQGALHLERGAVKCVGALGERWAEINRAILFGGTIKVGSDLSVEIRDGRVHEARTQAGDSAYVLSGPKGTTIVSVAIYRETRDRPATEPAPIMVSETTAAAPPPANPAPSPPPPAPLAAGASAGAALGELSAASTAHDAQLSAQLSASLDHFQRDFAIMWSSFADLAAETKPSPASSAPAPSAPSMPVAPPPEPKVPSKAFEPTEE